MRTRCRQGRCRRAARPSRPIIVGGARDPAERAAETAAASTLRGQRASLVAAPAVPIRRAATGGTVAPGRAAAPSPAAAASAVRSLGAGRPLGAPARAFFGPRLGRDLSAVRLHEGAAADRAARALDARAFAHGTDIAFAAGARERGGLPLLAHELAHAAAGDRVIRRSCHDGKCGECAGGEKTLPLSFFFRIDPAFAGTGVSDIMGRAKTIMAAVKKDTDWSQRVLANCCVKLAPEFDFNILRGPTTFRTASENVRTSGPHRGMLDYPAHAEDLGEGKTFDKAKGVPVVVVDEVLGTGGGEAVTQKADPEYTGKPYCFFAVAKSNTAVPTIAHELWHVAGQVNHDASLGGTIVAGTGTGVNARYCSEMRKLP